MKTMTIAGLSLALALIPAFAGAQKSYPTKPVRFILPFPPGGGTDTLGRAIGQKLGESLGQTIVLDNRPGAGANIGAEIAAHAVPDFKERLAASGFEPETSTPDEFTQYMRSEVAKWGKVVKAANLKVE